ncbi:MAG: prephenate dehydrogenase dimerization domain-containing protein, partial [Acidimicrobiales bacterium]
LMEFADDISSAEGGLPLVTAGGFRDMTRIASSSPELWIDIVRENRRAVLDIVRRFQEALEAAVFSVEAQDWQGLGRTLAAAREARDRLSGKLGLAAKEMFELAVPVPDRPGILAEVTTTIGEAGINIEDIDIVHSTEGGRGTIHLTLAGEEAARRAGEVLERRGFSVSRRRG